MFLSEKILFNEQECKSIISNTNEDFINWNINDRNYNSKSIYYTSETKWIFDKLKSFFELETGLKIIKNKEEIHFHKFTNGNWFNKHNDIRDSRLYAIGVLLNDDFNGGEFKLYNPNEITLNKKIGNSYIFDVRIIHEITPIIESTRYSLLWFLQQEHIKMNINTLI